VTDVLQADQLELVRLCGQLGARLVLGDHPSLEALTAADDPSSAGPVW